MKIGRQHGGAFLCDGVGLGKTFVGLMLIERLILHEGKRVVLFAPKTAKESVWEPHLREWLPHIGGVGGGADFSNLAVFSHTDLSRRGDFPARFRRVAELADDVIIDEAHHFRNIDRPGTDDREPSRYYRLYDLLDDSVRPKTVFMLTATPINNRLSDFRHGDKLPIARVRKNNTVGRVRHTPGVGGLGQVWINQTDHFDGVSDEVWQFNMGGYRPAEKWLKDRKSRTLTVRDIGHYQRIIAALAETIDLMGRITQVIHRHGGWPAAFQPSRQDVVPTVVPFRPRVVVPELKERHQTCVPLIPLRAATGAFSEPQHVEDDGHDWVVVNTGHRLRRGMFVAQVVGEYMDPLIPDGADCLFRSPVHGTRRGKTGLVQLRHTTDPESGQRYTVKRYQSVKAASDGSWHHTTIRLHPANRAFAPIVLTGVDEGELDVIAEFLEVLRDGSANG